MIVTARARTPVLASAVALLGCVALSLRSLAPVSVVATALTGVIGVLAWRVAERRPDPRRWIAVTAAGSLAFTATLAMGEAAAPRALAFSVVAVAVAAVAEEAFFRRFMYGMLIARGPVLAIAVTSIAFGLVHVPIYGWAILPLDIAAGVLLGWQRYAAGSWTAPMVTHLVANMVVFA